MTWEFGVGLHGTRVGDVGVTIRNNSGVAGTILAAVVYAADGTDPIDELQHGEVFASTLIAVPQTQPGELVKVSGSLGNVLLSDSDGDPHDVHFPFAHTLVFATGFMGATLPKFELASWVIGDCADAHSFVEEFPQDDESMPLETAPEFFLTTT
jgi:hypothetical protein